MGNRVRKDLETGLLAAASAFHPAAVPALPINSGILFHEKLCWALMDVSSQGSSSNGQI